MNKFRIIATLGYLILIFGLFVFYFYLSLFDYSGDVKNHVAWGKSIVDYGTMGFFGRNFPGYSFPTYPPFIMLLFAFCYWLYQASLNLAWFLNNTVNFFPSNIIHFLEWDHTLISYLKIPGIVGTILSIFVIKRFFELFKTEGRKKIIILGLFILNPAVIYLSSVWGQTDLLQYAFILAALYLLFRKKFWLSILMGGLALMSKQTALVLWGVYLLTVWWQLGVKKALLTLGATIGIIYLMYLPFHDFSLTWPIYFYKENFSLVNFLLSENSINLWGAIANFQAADSSQKFLFLTLDMWGNLLFVLFTGPITILILKNKFRYETYFHYLFIISITYFFFFTRMHERYLIPAILFSTLTLIWGKKYYLNFIFFSILHFLNLYRGLFVPSNELLSSLVRSIPFLNGLVIFYGIFIIYNLYILLENIRKVKDVKA